METIPPTTAEICLLGAATDVDRAARCVTDAVTEVLADPIPIGRDPEAERALFALRVASKAVARMIAAGLLVVGCGGSTALDVGDAGNAGRAPESMCLFDDGSGDPCNFSNTNTTQLATWYWLDTTKNGEQVHDCRYDHCPTGATCIVQSDQSGLDDGGELLIGTCQ